jgi:hypothetical protein
VDVCDVAARLWLCLLAPKLWRRILHKAYHTARRVRGAAAAPAGLRAPVDPPWTPPRTPRSPVPAPAGARDRSPETVFYTTRP